MKRLKRIFAVFCCLYWLLAFWVAVGRPHFVRSCTVCIAEWQQAAENRHDYFPGMTGCAKFSATRPIMPEVTMLLDNGVDLHSYQPTADDIIKISDCDLFIYVGGESDGWVEDALKEATNKDMQVINLLDVLGEQVKRKKS